MKTKTLAILILLTLAALLSSKALARPLADSISPTLGSELLTDGGLENWTSATNLTSWTETTTGTSTVNREATTIHGGTYSARLDQDASNSNAMISQTEGQATGSWLYIDMWARSSGAGKTMKVGFNASVVPNMDPGTNWVHYYNVLRVLSTDGTAIFYQRALGSASASLYWDDLSLKKITLSSMFGGTVSEGTSNITTTANWTIVSGTQGGVVASLNSTSSPTYFVIAYHDGTNFHLDQCLNGTYTSLINTAVTYSAGAAIKIIRQGTTYQAYYNGAQVGADQEITNSYLGNIYGAFSSHSGNTYTGLTMTDNSTPTPSNTPTNTSTATFTPTDTSTPTLTHTPGPTPTETNTPTITPTFTATPIMPAVVWDPTIHYGNIITFVIVSCISGVTLLLGMVWLIKRFMTREG